MTTPLGVVPEKSTLAVGFACPPQQPSAHGLLLLVAVEDSHLGGVRHVKGQRQESGDGGPGQRGGSVEQALVVEVNAQCAAAARTLAPQADELIAVRVFILAWALAAARSTGSSR